MKVSLEGKVVLVTGAASGIGAAIALEAAMADPAGLMLTDRDAKPLARIAERCGAAHIVADLEDPNAPQKLAVATIEEFSRVDGLVNAAGLTHRGGIDDGALELWETLFVVNARAPFFLMQHVIADMQGRGANGSIVNILSMNAHCGEPELGVYSATKGALATLTKNIANTCLADGIRVNGLNVGWVATESEHHMQSKMLGKGPDWERHVSAKLPLGRMLRVEEVARHAVFQLSKASEPMTGVCLDLEQKVVGA